MNAISWLALGLGLLLVPLSSASRQRAESLAARGRVAIGAAPQRALPVPRWDLVAAVVSIAAAAVTGIVGGLALGAAAGVVAATASYLALGSLRARVQRRREADLLTAVRLIGAELDAGAQPAAACLAAATVPSYRDVFLAAAEAARAGEDPELPGAELAGLGHAWRMAAVTGAPLAGVVERVADDLAARVEQRRAVSVALAGPRSSGVMLAVLPALGLLLGATMQAHPVEVLVGTPSGRLLCLVGVVLDSAGILWTARLTSRAARE